VVAAGNVKVKINKAGIEAAEKTVAAHKAPVVNNDISYGAAADGSATATSTKINFTFGAAVEGLTAAHISLANDTGAVTKGALSGSGTNYSLGITVNTAGNVKVGINKAGIEAAEKTVAVYRFIPPPDITYTATADGNATTTSTNINFVFNAAVTELVAGNISVGNGTGAVTKGTLTGSGANWSLGITVATAGSVKVKINKAGIEDTEKDVTVQKFIPATYTAAADGTANITTSTKIDFSFDKAIENLTAEQITVTDDTGAVTKGALTGSGISWSLGISVTTAGNVKVGIANPGIETTEKNVVVHKLVPLTYTATPDGGVRAASTKIDFSFGAAVVDLNVEQITLTGDTGAVTKGSLTGSGTSWSLGISVTTPGKVQVGIANPRIEDTAKNVTVYKPITYIAAADGASNTTTSTAIDFTFTAAVSDLAAGDISVTGGTGSVTTGGLTGSGKTWFLGITEVNTAGTVKVRINKDGIENVEKTVTAHKAAVSSLTGEVEFGQTSGSADVTVGTPSGGSDDPVASLDISAGEKGAVYFVAYKTTAQTITPSAANGVKVTVHTSGTVDGESADNETAVIEVKTGDLPFEGGTGSFTLTVNEAALDSRTINVSLSITANKTGAAAFKVTRDGQNKVETLERLGGGSSNFAGLEAAITWVETYAEADTEYLIRVEQNETGLPGLALSFNNNAGVTMRLRGTKEGPWILRHNNINNTLLAVKGYTYSAVSSNRNFITIGNQGSALVLGNNITVAGFGTSTQGTYVWQTLVYVMANAKLIMEPGSKITDWYSDMSGAGLGSPIYIQSNNQASRDPTTHGHLRIEGGSITNCIFKLEYLQGTTMTYSGLVYVSSREGRMALGSLYKAASTAENPIVFSGNSSNEMYIHSASGGNPATRYDLSQAGELSIPTQ
jgi:hypothetical protein